MHMHVPRLHVPRPRVHRLIYLLMGAALAGGLLVSVLVRPQPSLAASQACYGVCPSVTTISLSSSTVTYGNEQDLKFTASVTADPDPAASVATGSVIVVSRRTILCVIHLSGGKGSCSPAAKALAPGRHRIVAYYTGDANFNPSTSNGATLTVLNPSVTTLSLSRSTVTYGDETSVRFRVTVSAGTPGIGVPTGYAVVESGTTILCSLPLRHGRGMCSPNANALTPGSHAIVARYTGSGNIGPSASSEETLLVVSPSVTALSLSPARVTYGDEHVVRFSVKVSAGAPGAPVPAGSAVVQSGGQVLCSIHLSGGRGMCSPAAKALAPGVHAIVARYAGDTVFQPSSSSRKNLLVLAP
jgi:hypothetical protein